MNSTSGTSLATELVAAFSRFGPAYMKWLTSGMAHPTYARMRVLHMLDMFGPQIMSALGDRLGVTPRNVTILVDGLEDEGLARRRSHPDDRRATLVELTDRGREVVVSAFREHTARAAVLFERLTGDQQEALLTLIGTLTDELSALGIDVACAPDRMPPHKPHDH